MIDTSDIDVFLGLDVGKGEHTPPPSPRPARKAFDKRLPNTEPKLRELFAKLQAKHGTVLVVVDQPASIGALPLAVARDNKKIAQGKHHTQALLCLARRRADVLFAMLRDGTFYEPQPLRTVTPQT